MELWNIFTLEFPTGRINRIQMVQLIKKVFPRCRPETVIDNFFKIFDPCRTGFIRFTDLLIVFSMSMRGSAEEKLHWAFRLYDQDRSGDIDEEEMVDMFTKLCRIVEKEQLDEEEERIKNQAQEAERILTEASLSKKTKKVNLLSEKHRQREKFRRCVL
ncbi:neuronal calcium sensor 2 [Eurytemora carolleeae]|uniref:neuronal calcium sensor 2 n=1 Tax=Eurytemora carolleeae TaxID=1294199 RepID=UPI000C788987|nr:neuronal calcium sensor 2 [Eurytemora carolleeae]|eukprot:XP_023343792.1 neuronal calcium sensor 2-like [Eurytemora affinis]